ncbi:hypothetical protein ElyMa_003376500 [Elysia marginata]|uniref:Uncharacterized protein n=1 Tax=Elysia marginata TaxID=1093978 RepID=A0AAV4JKU3_9GAST|nr:hypothetical protein ElyMa_003376500 [Elysia marginata]
MLIAEIPLPSLSIAPSISSYLHKFTSILEHPASQCNAVINLCVPRLSPYGPAPNTSQSPISLKPCHLYSSVPSCKFAQPQCRVGPHCANSTTLALGTVLPQLLGLLVDGGDFAGRPVRFSPLPR